MNRTQSIAKNIVIIALLLSGVQNVFTQGLVNARPLKIFSSGSPINSISLQGPLTYSSVYTLTLPAAAPALNQLLISDASGILSWGQISNAQISNSAAIDYSKLNLTNNIVSSDIVNAAITLPKISSSGATTGQVIGFDGSNIVWRNNGLTNLTDTLYTAVPNATVNAAQLRVTGGTTNTDFVLSPRGTGALLANVPDNTVTGGNKRGANAVDWQTLRSDASQVASGSGAVIGGGDNNTASGMNSTIAGGQGNIASFTFATVGGGHSNIASSLYSTVGGGHGNEATAAQATVGGGNNNKASYTNSTVAGGALNWANGLVTTIGGGSNNTATGTYSTVGGGLGNTTTGAAEYGTIGGGSANGALGISSTVSGGFSNQAGGDYSCVPGGRGLTLSGNGSFGYLGANSVGSNDMVIAAVNTTVLGNTDLWLANNDNTTRSLRFYEQYNTAGTFPNGTNYVGFKAPNSVAADVTWTLPAADGTSGQALTTNGSGVLDWTNIPTSLPPSGAAGGDLTGTYPNPVVAANAVTSAKIADGTIANADVSPTAAIAYSKVALTNSIVTGDLTNNSVDGSKIALGSDATGDVMYYNGTDYVRLAAGTNGQVLTLATGIPSWATPAGASGSAGGDLTGSYPNPTIANSSVTSAKIADGTIVNADVNTGAAIAYSKLNLNNSIVGSDVATGTFSTTDAHIAIGNNDNTARELRFLEPVGSGSNYTAFKAQAQSADITYTLPAAAGTNGQVLSTNGSNVLSWASVIASGSSAGGDLSGTYPNPQIAAGTILDADINGSAAIAYSKLNLTTSIVNGDISSSAAIAYSKLALTNSIVAGDISSSAVTTAKIANNAVDGTKIALGSDATGDVMYYNGTDYVRLGVGSSGQVLTVSGGIPSWATPSGLTNFTESVNTSAPNATIPVVRLLATNVATNVDIALSPKGTGALTAQTADNSTTGGNKRGQYSVDWQMHRSAATAVAAGNYNTIGGGQNNTTVQDYATVGGGVSNNNSGYGSTISGGRSNTASGNFVAIGGGHGNALSNHYSAIPGGTGLTMSGARSFGFHANQDDGSGNSNRDMSISADRTALLGNVDVWIANNDNTPRSLRFYEQYNTAGAFPNASNYVGFKAPNSIAADVTWTLPAADGTSGQVLSTDGSGTLSWATPSVADNAVSGAKIALGSDAAGDMMYYDGTDYARLPVGSTAQVLTVSSGVPTWSAPVMTNTLPYSTVNDGASVSNTALAVLINDNGGGTAPAVSLPTTGVVNGMYFIFATDDGDGATVNGDNGFTYSFGSASTVKIIRMGGTWRTVP